MNFSGLVIFSTFWNFIYAEPKPALLFDWKEDKLVEMSEYHDRAIWKQHYISACPASSHSLSHELLNNNVSITKKALFSHPAYPLFPNPKKIGMKICHNSFTPALVWNYQTFSYDVGYELYYEKGEIGNMELKASRYDCYLYREIKGKFDPKGEKAPDEDLIKIDTSRKNLALQIGTGPKKIQIIGGESSHHKTIIGGESSHHKTIIGGESSHRKPIFGRESSHPNTDPPAEHVIKIKKKHNIAQFKISSKPGKTWTFYWIDALSFDISRDRKRRIVKFKPDEFNHNSHKVASIHCCKTYFAGDGEEIKYNTPKNSPERHAGIPVPDIGSQTKDKSKEFVDRLVKTQILPMRMFHTLAARLTTCVYLNFAFIWETIANETLKKIDLFVYAIHREGPVKLLISFGVYGKLKNINPIAKKEIESENPIFHILPIPRVVFRLIQIQGKNMQFYGVAIIIHNDIKPVENTDRICSTEDEVEGWDDVKNTNSATGFSYTCPLTKEVLIKLGKDVTHALITMEPLKLNEFPPISHSTWQIDNDRNFLERVKNRLQVIEKQGIVE